MNVNYKELSEYLFKLRKNLDFDKERQIYLKIKNHFKDKPLFRLEKNGLGPWNSFREDVEDTWIDSDFRRGLERDSSNISDVWRHCKPFALSACYSIENLKSWFSKTEFDRLLSQGYEVKEYLIDRDFVDVFLGDNQVLLLINKGERELVLDKTKEYRIKEAESFDRLINISLNRIK